MEIKIEKNVPVPENLMKKSGVSRELIRSMEIGDSFVVESERHVRLVSVAACALGFRIARQRSEGKIRIWRIS